MRHVFLIFPLALALSASAHAAPGQEPRQASPQQQLRKTDYWLSRDMQKLVFWQSRTGETRAAGAPNR